MIVLSSFLAEGLEKGKKNIKRYFLFGGFICILSGMGFAIIYGISRPYISLPYILISVGISSLLYYFLYWIYEQWGKNYSFAKKERIFSAVGKNSFIFYLLHILIVYSIYTIFPFNTTSVFIFPLAIVHTTIIWLLAYFLNKEEIYIII
jgi:predicted acyltransferase